MANERSDYEEKTSGPRSGNLAVAETLRSVSVCKDEPESKAAKSEEKISVFWRVFGGTLLSIGALVVMTAYSGITGSIAEVRRDLNQESEKRSEYARKDELTSRITSQWSAIKEVQKATGDLGTVQDRVKVLDQQLERAVKNDEDYRRDVNQKIADQRKTSQDDKVDLARQLDDQRKALESKHQEVQRKLDDQRRAADDDRKELQRKIDDQRKTFDDERRDLLTRVQTLSERLATVEVRASLLSNTKVQAGPTSGN